MKFIKNLRNAINFAGLPRSERRIVFYSEGEPYWVHLEPILKNFLEISDVPATYISSSGDDPGLKYEHEQLRHFVTDDGWVRNWLFENIDTDVVVMTMPDLDSFQIKRSRNPVHYVYVQHSLVSLHMVYREHAFDSFDTLFCAGPHHVQEMKAIVAAHSLSQKNIVEHGYGRLDSIVAAASKRLPRQKQSDAPIHVLVAPSWGDSMIVESIGAQLVATLLLQGFQVTLRPHPQTVKFSRAKLETILRQHESNPLFASELSLAGQESLHHADVMISDWSGAALDFAFGLQKPVLFVDVPRKVNNQNYESLNIEPFEERIRDQIGMVLHQNEIEAAPSAVTELVSSPRFSPAKLNEMREANVFNVGASGQVGALELVKLLEGSG